MKLKYKIQYNLAQFHHKFYMRMKGDTSCFRYPHLKYYSKNFDSDLKHDIFLLKRNEVDIMRAFGREFYPIIQNINTDAYHLYISRLLSLPISEAEKIRAYKSVCKTYKSHAYKKLFPIKYRKIDFNSLTIQKGYEDIKKYYHHSTGFRTYLNKIKKNNNRNLAFSVHGTNILYIDNESYNYGVGLIDAIMNYEGGIKGHNLKNLEIEETWAKLPHLMLYYLKVGFPKEDPDMFFIKGYLGQAFNKKDTMYNALYAFTEPFMKLLFSTIDMKALMDYAFQDDETSLKAYFEEKYPLFYEKIYHEKDIFKRMDIIKEMALYHKINIIEIYKILFNASHLVNTNIDYHVIALIYFSKKIRTKKEFIYDLIINCYPWSIEHDIEITLENWLKHIRLKYGDQAYHFMEKEKKTYQDILEKI